MRHADRRKKKAEFLHALRNKARAGRQILSRLRMGNRSIQARRERAGVQHLRVTALSQAKTQGARRQVRHSGDTAAAVRGSVPCRDIVQLVEAVIFCRK